MVAAGASSYQPSSTLAPVSPISPLTLFPFLTVYQSCRALLFAVSLRGKKKEWKHFRAPVFGAICESKTEARPAFKKRERAKKSGRKQ